jgi:hydrogenase maturation protease
MKKFLLIGYGNPGRGDDGLGPALAEAIEQRQFADVEVDIDFQLNVEDAYAFEGREAVIFADAMVKGDEGFTWHEIEPKDETSFTSHSVSPAGVMALAKKLFNIRTRGFVLAIRGYEFDEFGAPITERGGKNLRDAIAFLEARLSSGELGVRTPV